MSDVLVTGGAGQVGIALRRLSWPDDVVLHAPERSLLDLSDPVSIERTLAERPWSAILSCGAYTAVDKAETEVASAWAINAIAPALIAKRAGDAGVPIVHVSTDYVFSGTRDGFYAESDPVDPAGVYGASKAAGEFGIRTGNPRHAIVRTAWVASAYRTNFMATMLRLAASRDEVGVVADQIGCPTFADDLAAALQEIVLRQIDDPAAPAGTFHFVNAGEASWADFAEAIFAASARQGGPTARVRRITTAEYPTPARRPANSRLATTEIRRAFGIVPRPWREALGEAVPRMPALA